jgi:ABC-type phosphate/phosphonate transport system substrate-binding protein
MPRPIANARMYSVAPGATAAWKRLFALVIERSGVPLEVVDHAFPLKLADLWARDDLALAFMCGWPFVRTYPTYRPVAAPIPTIDGGVPGKPFYCTHFVVRADSPFRALPDTFGHRFAYTIEDSHSGYSAPRHHLMRYRKSPRDKLYREIIGPLTTPRRMLEAIVDGRTDVGPLDAYAFALLIRHEPSLRAVRVIASTEPVQMPAFVASPGTEEAVVARLRAALVGLTGDRTLAEVASDLCLAGFSAVEPGPWQITEQWAQAAERQGHATIT